jgi:hypothetical protein
VKMIKTARLKWLRHIAKKKNYVFGIQIIFTQPEFSIEKGRTTLRLLDLKPEKLKNLRV